MLVFEVSPTDDGMRLDRWVKKNHPLPHTLLQRFLRQGKVRVDGKKCEASTRLEVGQSVKLPETEVVDKHNLAPSREKFERAQRMIKDMIIFEDESILILNKPSGLAVQGGTGMRDDHIDGYMKIVYEENAPRLVHRIDKETSGLLIMAKTAAKARELGDSFKDRKIEKTYLAVLKGVPEVFEGEVKAPLSKERGDHFEKVRVNDEGKFAKTLFKVLDHAFRKLTLIELKPLTGRTHQLRAHMELLKTPILGDTKYNGQWEERTFPLHLHAWKIELLHKGRVFNFEAPLPKAFKDTLKEFGLSL